MNLKSINQFSRDYEIPAEDVLLIDFNRKGLSTTLKYERVRFYFTLIDHPSFQTSKELGIKNFFFGVPTKSGVNDYTLEEGSVFLGSEKIGDVEYIADDTCDSTYSRKDGKVLVLNSRSKGSCVGCDFCHTFQQTPNDDLYFEDDELIPYSIDRWLEGNERDDLSHLEQISILTGCFGSEDEVLDHIDLVRRIAPTYGFNNEILYYGSELRSENALKKLADLGPIEFCLSLLSIHRVFF